MNRRDFIFNGSAGMAMLVTPFKVMDSTPINIDNHNVIRINGFEMIDYFLNHKMKYIYEFKICTWMKLLQQGYYGQYFDTAVFMGKVPENKIQYGLIKSPLPDEDHLERDINIQWSEKVSEFSKYIERDWA